MSMNKEKQQDLQKAVNHPKHELMEICNKMEKINPTLADQLSRLIGKLEAWQHKR